MLYFVITMSIKLDVSLHYFQSDNSLDTRQTLRKSEQEDCHEEYYVLIV
jgi:hypothetical protein